jgi:phosphatidylglycerophosphate synthase
MDPIADKILILFILIALTINLESIFIGIVGAIMLAREFWVAALRDLNARNNNLKATEVTFLAKIKTSIQLFALGGYILALLINNSLLLFLSDFFLLTAMIITLKTGLTYSIQSFKASDNKN